MKWCDPGGLSKSVKHTKRTIALTYDEMNIHEMGLVIMKNYYAKVNECGDKMKKGQYERWEQSQMSLISVTKNRTHL